jgi:hypothetical protein
LVKTPLIKTLNKLGIEGSYLNIIKAVYNKSIVHIILNGQKSKTIRNEVRVSLSPLFLNIVLEILARAMSQEKKIVQASST